jgi:hypothetical protein
MNSTNALSMAIGITTIVICLGLVVFAVPAASIFRRLQSRLYGERIGRIQTPGMVRLAAVPGVGLGLAIVTMAALGAFGPQV